MVSFFRSCIAKRHARLPMVARWGMTNWLRPNVRRWGCPSDSETDQHSSDRYDGAMPRKHRKMKHTIWMWCDEWCPTNVARNMASTLFHSVLLILWSGHTTSNKPNVSTCIQSTTRMKTYLQKNVSVLPQYTVVIKIGEKIKNVKKRVFYPKK